MRLVLDFWNRRWQSVSYDTATGVGRVRWFRRNPKENRGWAYRQKGQWYSVWKERHRLVFQAGSQQWGLGSEVACEFVDTGTTRRFILTGTSSAKFEIEYQRKLHKRDPTFDDLDDEMEDFFLWLSRLCCDLERQAKMLSQYP